MEYMIVYPLPENYKNTCDNEQRVVEKFKKFFEVSKFPIEEYTFDHVYNFYNKIYKYVCLSSVMDRPEYYKDMPSYLGFNDYIILNEDDNSISIGEL